MYYNIFNNIERIATFHIEKNILGSNIWNGMDGFILTT